MSTQDVANERPRPDFCCGACPAVVVNPEHVDCEECRTGYDCTCRVSPSCPNYQETDDE